VLNDSGEKRSSEVEAHQVENNEPKIEMRTMKITIYGMDGCSNCSELVEKTQTVIDENNINATVEKESDTTALAENGIMSTPGFEIDDEIVFTGSNPSKEELKTYIEERA
jgi:small redox-active disulfide protein 2